MLLRELREIGSGGFGVVHHVVDLEGNEYARKTFRPSQVLPPAQIDRLRKRFVREVITQKELGGNEVIPVLHETLVGEEPWFLMPLAGKTYQHQIEEDRRAGKVSPEPLCDIMNALHYLHDIDYVHRDLNPKNVLFHDGKWKLSDFGAVLPPAGQTRTLTAHTAIFTELYCAPEQRQDFHNARTAADIYSFGCILHDVFSGSSRRPYAKHTATGPMGPIIEKCTQEKPERRPNITVVRELVLEELLSIQNLGVEPGTEGAEWLEKLKSFEDWSDPEFEQFGRYFVELDLTERAAGHDVEYVYALSTPFLTRMPVEAMARIATKGDGIAEAIIEKYCEWVRGTAFSFPFADSVCARLVAVFDNGSPAFQALAMGALVHLGSGHHRYYVMRQAMARCRTDVMAENVAKRVVVEIKSDDLVDEFRDCARTIAFDVTTLATPLSKLLQG
jgi:serine/threonine protein kinase